MFRRQGWIVLGRIDALLKPLSPRGFLHLEDESSVWRRALGYMLYWVCRPVDLVMTSLVCRRYRHLRIEPVDCLDSSIEPLLARRLRNSVVCCDRSVEFLNWRFVECPVAHRYRSFGLWEDKELRGFVVLRRADRFGKDIMYIDELIADEQVLPRLAAFVIQESYRQGVDAIYYEGLGEKVTLALRKCGFVRRDSGHYFVIHSRDDSLTRELSGRENWTLTFADSDMGFRHDR